MGYIVSRDCDSISVTVSREKTKNFKIPNFLLIFSPPPSRPSFFDEPYRHICLLKSDISLFTDILPTIKFDIPYCVT
jgi:hypothetical protein